MLSADGDVSVDAANSGSVALDKLLTAKYDAVVSDYHMSGMNGIDLLREARSRGYLNTFILFTDRGDEQIALDAIINGADHYLPKTSKASQDMALIRSILAKKQKRVQEEKEKQDEASYRSLVMRMNEGFAYHRIIYDQGGRPVSAMLIDVNDAFERIFGLLREVVLGRDLRDFLPDAEGYERKMVATMQQVMATGNDDHFEARSSLLGKWFSVSIYMPEPGSMVTIIADITAQKKQEERLKRDGEFYMRLFEDLPIPTWVTDPEGNCTFFNRAWLDLTGRSVEEEKALSWEEGIHPDEKARAKETFQTALSSRKPFRVEYRLMGADGRYHHVADHGHPIYDPYANFIGFLGTCYDLTERRELEQAIREREARYSSMFHGNHAVMLLIDGDSSTIVDVNQAAVEFYGHPREQLIGMNIDEISQNRSAELIRELNEKGTRSFVVPRKHRVASGEIKDVEAYLSRLDADGRVRWLDIVFDVSDRSTMEESLERQRRDYETVFNSTSTMIAIRDAEGRVIRSNLANAKRMGVTQDTIVGMSLSDLVPSDAREIYEEDLEVIRTGLPKLGMERSVHLHSGEFIWTVTDKLPYRDLDGSVVGVIVFTIDITSRKVMEDELELARKKLYLLGSITRHDLLNQLTALNGYLGIAQYKAEEQVVKDYLAKALRAGEGMRKILEFSRDYEKMGSKRPEWFSAQDAAEKGVAEVQAGEAKMSIDLSEVELLADRMVEKAFHNLADNAVRHGKATRVSFTYERAGEDLKIICQDNGEGVPDSKRGDLFDDRFGHGLYLVKEVLKMTGMSITETAPRKGARFVITIPKGNFRITGSK